MKIPEHYIEKVYAGWLGKLIGIRMGSAIEGWDYHKIRRVLGELDGYPHSYKNFAADDDSNGPLFFIRGLAECRDRQRFSPQDVGDALLNYAPYEHGFFWWGGYGVSTEHTAYLNLQAGIPAPRSGSIAQNGAAVAEQIGGQIFIDPWGYVAPGDPTLAASLAEKAASVTHDGNGVYGGIYVACCISLAFVEPDLPTVLEKALAYIPADCEYARVVRAVRDFHKAHPQDWRDCYRFVEENFGYDKYPGNCHIIPNAGVMVLSMLYGEGDFGKTLCICNMCGWDTDCNVGNVGSILGIHCGLEGIDYEKWRAPIGDFLANSCVIPSLNAMDVPYGASYFAKLGYELAGERPAAPWDRILGGDLETCHFEYPGSTHAFRSRGAGLRALRNTGEDACTGSRCLQVSACGLHGGEEACFYKQTYYSSQDFTDSRYDPFFAPLAYPGQTVKVSAKLLESENLSGSYLQLYAKNGATGEVFRGQRLPAGTGWRQLTLSIPGGQEGHIQEVGVILGSTASGFAQGDLEAFVDDLSVAGAPDYRLDFSHMEMDQWTGLHREVPQFGRFKGHCDIDGPWLSLSCADAGEAYTGHHLWQDYKVTATLRPEAGEIHLLQVRVQGALRCYAGGFWGKGNLALLKNSKGYVPVAQTHYPWEPGKEYRLTLEAKGDRITLYAEGEEVLSWRDEEPYPQGCAGLAVREGSRCLTRDWVIEPA